MPAPSNPKSIKSRINRVKNLILKKISDDIEKKQKRIPSKEEVVAIYEKRRAEHEKKVAELEKKQEVIAPVAPLKKGLTPKKPQKAPALAPAPLKKGLTPKKARIV